MTTPALFGELRAALQAQVQCPQRILSVLMRAKAHDAAQYTDAWLPYLAAHDLPVFTVPSLRALAIWRPLLPEHTEYKYHTIQLDELFASEDAACLTHLSLSGVHHAGMMKQFVQKANLPRLKWLDCANNDMGQDGLSILLRASFICALESLYLFGNRLKNSGAIMLAQCAHLAQLTTLDVGYNQIGAKGYLALSSSVHLAGLKTLRCGTTQLDVERVSALFKMATFRLNSLQLAGCHLNAETFKAVVSSPVLSQLTHLRLGNNRLDDDAVRLLKSSVFDQHLQHLDLNGQQAGCALGVIDMARSGALPNLEYLDLGRLWLRQEGIDALGQSAWSGLKSLKLRANMYDGDEIDGLFKAAIHKQLNHLNVSKNVLNDAQLCVIAEHMEEMPLSVLNISHNEAMSSSTCLQFVQKSRYLNQLSMIDLSLDDQDAIAIAQSKHMYDLTVLELAHNQIGDRGMCALAQSPYLAKLKSFSVGSHVADEGAMALADSAHFTDLKQVWLMKNNITDVGARALAQSTRLPKGVSIDVYECPCDASEIMTGSA